MKPNKSYIIWFSQRTGSSLLNKTLENINIAGKPNEWLTKSTFANMENPEKSLQEFWGKGMSDNGVFGVKISYNRQLFINTTEMMKKLPGASQLKEDIDIWNNVFPNCKHIFMTRRNKIRLAVSWWRAIQSGEWHRKYGEKPMEVDLKDKYLFDAINQLYMESSMREAGIQDFFSKSNITPLTIVYEDFITNYDKTIKDILDYLEINYNSELSIPAPYLEKIADKVSEEWVQRFREERQKGWTNIGW